eukprot:6744074-Prymnesium_polylepis.1
MLAARLAPPARCALARNALSAPAPPPRGCTTPQSPHPGSPAASPPSHCLVCRARAQAKGIPGRGGPCANCGAKEAHNVERPVARDQ